MIIAGTAVVIDRDDVDTDVLYPGQYLNVDDPERMREHLFEGLDPSLRDRLVGDTVLVTGANFGSGSSREHVPHAMRASGIRCVVGTSFARIFHRNCVNLGLPIVACEAAARAARPGSRVEVDTDRGTVLVDGTAYDAPPMPPFMLELLAAGGLVAWGRRRAGKEP